MKKFTVLIWCFALVTLSFAQLEPYIITNLVEDKCIPIPYKNQKLVGLFGQRLNILVDKGLLGYDLDSYLEAYYGERIANWPTGEYLGKYFIASLKMYEYTNSTDLKNQLKRILKTWKETMPEDGYQSIRMNRSELKWLGDFTGLWELKYVLLALVDYYVSFGDEEALTMAKKIGNRIVEDFGYGEGKRDIMSAGALRLGTASVLEPMVYLYRITGEPQFLEFCNYVMIAHEQDPNGTKMISEILYGSGKVNQAGGIGVWQKAKAYEMLSAYIGILRMYELTGRQQYLDACLAAWEDIFVNRLYIVGTTSAREFFQDDKFLPGEQEDVVGEGCATSHWISFSRELFYLTADVKYIDAIERAQYNVLLGSNSPHNAYQSYFTPLNGHRKYELQGIKTDAPPCCHSNVLRSIARTPEITWTKFKNGGLALLIYNPGVMHDQIMTENGDNVSVSLEVKSDFPVSGQVKINMVTEKASRYRLALRVPEWCPRFRVTIGLESYYGSPGTFLNIIRKWQGNEMVDIDFELPVRFENGRDSYPYHHAIVRGPQVLVADQKLNATDINKIRIIAKYPIDLKPVTIDLPEGWFGNQVYKSDALISEDGKPVFLVPFADAGQFDRSEYRTWFYQYRGYNRDTDQRHTIEWFDYNNYPELITTIIEDSDPAWKISGEVKQIKSNKASGGSFLEAQKSATTFELTFTGIQIRVRALKKPEYWTAHIILDGKLYTDIRYYELDDDYRTHIWMSPLLPDGDHTLKIVADGQISLDYVEIRRFEYKPAEEQERIHF
jgi:uncharacterized protein